MRLALISLGIILAAAGTLFALQGFGVVAGSPMTGTTTWSVLGPVIAIVGVVLIGIGSRTRPR
ncbi:hypothetical protein LV457_11435 [Mycobacterium sp. MYCO198283]|uniref:hypothetical protein n=1 Tax=Mycobacterium sp. MYCO198283 TaxID=2883505 RepID=UPI001E344AA2|nr:hypothetical protein [Mycobacterium sp. MYCO198283]MCG5432895.1 hypothetical protein [Mycobacterium sp. MYCO198283]